MDQPREPVHFRAWAKISRLNREVVITEKIDGTNGAVGIEEYWPGIESELPADAGALVHCLKGRYLVYAQSRTRVITPAQDNHGFAGWVHDNAYQLVHDLGPGLHFGEWWGYGINRGYGLKEKRFSLFNTNRWEVKEGGFQVPGLYVVPVLATASTLATPEVELALTDLRDNGSAAAPGYMNPEGVVIFHKPSQGLFKVTLVGDDRGKNDG
jgi:RNA ligase